MRIILFKKKPDHLEQESWYQGGGFGRLRWLLRCHCRITCFNFFKKSKSELDQVKTDNRRSSAYLLKTAKSLINFGSPTRLSQK